MQKVVGRGQRDGAPETQVQRLLDLAHHQNAAGLGSIKERLQECLFFLAGQILPPATAGFWAVLRNFSSGLNEAPSQLASPARGNSESLRGLLHRQAHLQRQQHRLSLPQLVHRRCLPRPGLRMLQHFRTACRSPHRPSPVRDERRLFH